MAIGDVQTMTRAFRAFYEDGKREYIDSYSDTSLKRVWQVQRFASMLCYNLHRFPEHNIFEHKMQIAELNNMTHSKEAMRALAQNYTGVPYDLFYDLD
jgi:p-hydroxybenzoate 3-monooxygenase